MVRETPPSLEHAAEAERPSAVEALDRDTLLNRSMAISRQIANLNRELETINRSLESIERSAQ